MSPWWIVALAYLLGSVPFSYIIVRISRGIDVRTVGSGNPGATNVMRAAGRGPAALALLLDVGKGVAAVVGARLLEAPGPVVAAAGVAAVAGHMFPVFLRGRGGKGVATAAGALGALVPWALASALALFIGVVAWKRYVSLGSLVAAAAFPLLVVLFYRLGWTPPGQLAPPLAASVVISGLVILRHAVNIRRLVAGTESKLGQKPVPAAGGEPLDPR